MMRPSGILLYGSIAAVGVWGIPAWAGEPLTAQRVASGMTAPLYVTHAPGDTTRVFVLEQAGRIRIIDISQDSPTLLAQPFLDIVGRVRSGGERGLLGMAFHPEYPSPPYFYVNYTGYAGAHGDTVVSRFTVPDPIGAPNIADAASEMKLIAIFQPVSIHKGGWIAFSPNDNYLYIAMGDGGVSFYAQHLTGNLLGKILRIEVNGDDFPDDPDRNYSVPADNPFVGQDGDDEIWAYGLRNPWRNAFDSLTGDLYIADVGASDWEEVNFQPASSAGGENYGWHCREGMHDYQGDSACKVASFVEPIHEYPQGDECSITGGEVYRGCLIPSLHGTYFFADYCSAKIWSLNYTGAPPIVIDRTDEIDPCDFSIASPSGFGRDAQGEIYICDRSGGEVFRIMPAKPTVPCSMCGGATADELCDNDDPCDGVETCDLETRECIAGTLPVCDDGQFCNGVEQCGPCPEIDICCFPTGTCVDNSARSACLDNGGTPGCLEFACLAGTAPLCDDGIPCTIDSCDGASNRCVNAPNHPACGDGLFCNGSERCIPGLGCRSGPAPCMPSECNEAIDRCRGRASPSLRGSLLRPADKDP